jgi:hypothetical protein
MNLSKLGYSVWIILLNILLLFLLLRQLIQKKGESFVNIPQQVDPDAPIKEDPAIANANDNYSSLLLFLKDHPEKSGPFIKDIRSKFFANDCNVKSYIDFNNISSIPGGGPFV